MTVAQLEVLVTGRIDQLEAELQTGIVKINAFADSAQARVRLMATGLASDLAEAAKTATAGTAAAMNSAAESATKLARETALAGDSSAEAAARYELEAGALRTLSTAEKAQYLALAKTRDAALAMAEAQGEAAATTRDLTKEITLSGQTTKLAAVQYETTAGSLSILTAAEKANLLALAAQRDATVAAIALQAKHAEAMAVFGTKTGALGQKLTMGLTVPIVAIGALSVKAAASFDDAMAKVEGAAGAGAAEVAKLRGAVLALASDSGRAPEELAEGLYFIESMSYRGAAAMDILTRSSHLAEAGMGSTADVAKLTIFALKAYEGTGLTAARAMDIFAAAVREGAMAPDALAGAVGRVLPEAARLHVGLDELTGAIAGMTRIGLNADEAVTALRQTLLTMDHPSKQTQKALDSVGLKAAEVAKGLGRDLIGTLAVLANASEHGGEAFQRIFPNVRAFTGVLALTGNQLKSVRELMDRVTHSTGVADTMWNVASHTMGHELRQAIQDVKTAGIELGESIGKDVAPMFKDLAKDVHAAVDWYEHLSDNSKRLVIDTTAVLGAVGPLLVAVSSLVKTATACGIAIEYLNGKFLITATDGVAAAGGITAAGDAAAASALKFDVARAGLTKLLTAFGGMAAAAGFGMLWNGMIGDVANAHNQEAEADNRAAGMKGPSNFELYLKRRRAEEDSAFKDAATKNHRLLSGNAVDGWSENKIKDSDREPIDKIRADWLKTASGKHDAAIDAASKSKKATDGIHLGKGGGEDGKVPKAAAKAAKDYKDEIQRLTIALKEVGMTEEWQKAIVERNYGDYKDYTNAEWQKTYALIAQKNHLENLVAAQDKAAEVQKKANKDFTDSYIAKFKFDHEQKAEAIAAEVANKKYIAAQQKSFDLMGVTSEAAKVSYDIQHHLLDNLTKDQQKQALAIAKTVDAKTKEMEADQKYDQWRKGQHSGGFMGVGNMLNGMVSKTTTDQLADYRKMMDGLDLDMKRLTADTDEQRIAVDMNAKYWMIGQDKIDAAIKKTMELQNAQAWKTKMEGLADATTDAFLKSFDSINKGWAGVGVSMIQNFKDMLGQMGRDYLKSELSAMLKGMLTKSSGGASAKVTPTTTPGSMPWNLPVRWPTMQGDPAQNPALGSPTVHMHINTPDANSFQNSQGQIASSVGGMLQFWMQQNKH